MAARDYRVAVATLGGKLGPDWSSIDWNDRLLRWRFYQLRGVESAEHGWKIHISAAAIESPRLLTELADVLPRLRIPFKIPRRIEDVVFLNSGDAGREQLGKVVTVYPPDEQSARAAILELDHAWPATQGPEVQTDWHVRAGSAVSFRYGVFRGSLEVVSSKGVHEFGLRSPDGSVQPDTRTCDAKPRDIRPLPVVGHAPTGQRVRLNEPIRLAGAEYVALAWLGETPRVATFLAANVATLDTVVIKAGRRGASGDSAGTDVRDLLRAEFSVLQMLHRQPGVAPRAVGFVDDEWPVLIMEDFRGERLCDLPRQPRIESLVPLADMLARLHEAGLVHGDLKLENAVRRESGVGLIDFELAAPLGEPMRQCGTPGHLAPEVAAGTPQPAECSRDLYALGACVVHAVLDIPPGLLPAGAGRSIGLLYNERHASIARFVKRLLAAEPDFRPTARSAAGELRRHVVAAVCRTDVGRPSTGRDLRWCRRVSVEAAAATNTFLRRGTRGMCWRNDHFMRSFECEGINIGAAGIVLGLISIDQALGRNDYVATVDEGARWLASRPSEGKAAGPFTGNAGVALALAVTGIRLNESAYVAAARDRLQTAAQDRRELDLFCGSAGVIWAACVLREIVRDDWPLDIVRGALAHMMSHVGSVEDVQVWAAAPDRDRALFGCAHGSAGSALALASWARATGDHALQEEARDAFRTIARHARTSDHGALRIGAGDARHHAVGNWCHGVAGYLWAILGGLGDDPCLREEIDWAVSVLITAPSVGTATYCHGLAGQLELWRMLERIPRYREVARSRAGNSARALRIMRVQRDGHGVWTSDDPEVVTPDLWIGFLGPATALALHAAGVHDALLSAAWLSTCART